MKKEILIADDEHATVGLLKKILDKAGYSVKCAYNGIEAYNYLIKNRCDMLLTDWMMPQMDGIELIRKVRKNIDPAPAIIVLTALSSVEARTHAIESGADDFLAKPFQQSELLDKIKTVLLKVEQEPSPGLDIPKIIPLKIPAFNGICIAASSGGPQTFLNLFNTFTTLHNAAIFIVQHGPVWALKDMAERWNRTFNIDVTLGEDGMKIMPRKIYLAPGGCHMVIDPDMLVLRLNDDPPENFTKPAADPLFRSAARAFGMRSMAVVMTGMGSDGSSGAQYIAAAGGRVIVQDPGTAIVHSMPRATIKAVPDSVIVPLQELADTISKYSNDIYN